MNGIIVSQGILSPREVKGLEPSEREEYIFNAVKEILEKNRRRGVTIAEVEEATHFNRITVTKHLEKLVAIREAYKRKLGNTTIYRKNGKIVHETSMKTHLYDNKAYTFYLIENEVEGENFIYIQEKEVDSYMNENVNGGILINLEEVSGFINNLKKFVSMREINGSFKY